MFTKATAFALLCSVSAFASPARAAPDLPADELSSIPDVYISYYDVSGDSESAIRFTT